MNKYDNTNSSMDNQNYQALKKQWVQNAMKKGWSDLKESHNVMCKDDEDSKWILCWPCFLDSENDNKDKICYDSAHKNRACMGTSGQPFTVRLWNNHLTYQCHVRAVEMLSNATSRQSQTTINVFFLPVATSAAVNKQCGTGSMNNGCPRQNIAATEGISRMSCLAATNKSCGSLFHEYGVALRTGLEMMSTIEVSPAKTSTRPIILEGILCSFLWNVVTMDCCRYALGSSIVKSVHN